ncbi:MAG: AAA family ATPase, partial [Promethearchaeota archaeon]
KHLGRMFTGMSLEAAEDSIIRGHPQLTEEKMIATLNIAKLLNSGQEEVIWRKFTTSFWKVLDEVNRLSPYAQNILLSMLAEGKVKYYDHVFSTDKYVLYATLNPGDVGTFEMSPPFMDRFGISVYISMPTTHDLSIILESRDDKLLGYDEIMQVPAVLNKEQVLSIWFMVDKIKIGKSSENFIHSIVRDFTLCERIDKGNSEYLTPETGLCNDCHFNLKKLVCNKVISILSVRVAKDLLRYSKAMAWFLGFKEVTIDIISAVAPYVISHRVKFVERELNEAPYWGNKFEYTVNLIELVKKRFINREDCYEIVDKFRDGNGSDTDLTYLNGFKGSDLITKMDLIPLAKSLNNDNYKKIVRDINKFYEEQNLENLVELNSRLMNNLSFPNRGELINIINKYLKELTYWARDFTFRRWDIVRHTIAGMYAKFSKPLEESSKKQCTLQLRDQNLFLEINVTGIDQISLVQINCHGGQEAIKLREEIDENYPIETYNFSTEVDHIYEQIPEDFQEFLVSSDKQDKDEEKEKKDIDEADEVDRVKDIVDEILKEE